MLKMLLKKIKTNIIDTLKYIKKRTYYERVKVLFFFITILSIIIFVLPLWGSGHIVFSDLDFGFTSEHYIKEVWGIFNERWSTNNFFNIPRLIFVLPFYLIALVFDASSPLMIKLMITVTLLLAGVTLYFFLSKLIFIAFPESNEIYAQNEIEYKKKKYRKDIFKYISITVASVFYAINPWVILRIQHFYLLVGYALLPQVIHHFFNLFDIKYEKLFISDIKAKSTKIYRKNVFDAVSLAFMWSIGSAAIHFFFYNIILMGLLTSGLLLKRMFFNKAYLYAIGNFFKKWLIVGIFFLLFSSYWLVNYLFSVLFTSIEPNNINTIDSLTMFSRHSGIPTVTYLISYWWPMFDYQNLQLSFWIGGFMAVLSPVGFSIISKTKNNYVQFFGLLSIIFIVLSLGTSTTITAKINDIVVNKVPIIGHMFRDPNKLVGILAFNFSILISIGLFRLFEIIDIFPKIKPALIKSIVIFTVIFALYFYLKPFREQFIKGFYAPVEIPEEYTNTKKELLKNEYNKVLYIPVADNMTQSDTMVATPKWNNNQNPEGREKATGDLHVYSTPVDTFFHHEGADKNITYYFNFLQHLLDKGLSININNILSAIGADTLIYHNEYKGHEQRQSFNISLLDYHKDLKKTYENSIFSIYKPDNILDYIRTIDTHLYTTSNLTSLESLSRSFNIDSGKTGLFFLEQKKGISLEKLMKGDYLETRSYKELLITQLPEQYFLKPFEYINHGNSFVRWSKNFVKNADWLWHLRSQGVDNYNFDFDFSEGFVFTYASAKLDVEPYLVDKIQGKEVYSFNSLLQKEKFFSPNNIDYFELNAYPSSDYNQLPVLRGEIVSGYSRIWEVAQSGELDAKPQNPYKFEVIISGRGVNKMHLKVRFYDSNDEEIGISYVVSPKYMIDFDAVRFQGEYVTPPDTQKMRIDILAYKKPEQKTYWWIHDIKIWDMEEFKSDNTIKTVYNVPSSDTYEVYARIFFSKRGGNLSFTINNNQKFVINANSKYQTGFKWIKIGEIFLEKGNTNVTIENLSGFNALNLITFIPVNFNPTIEKIMELLDSKIEKSNVFEIMELENDFDLDVNIQTKRNFPDLSFGRGISFDEGHVYSKLNIIKDSNYKFALNKNIPNDASVIELKLLDENGTSILNEKLDKKTASDYCEITKGKDEILAADYNVLDEVFPYKNITRPNFLKHYSTYTTESTKLEKGEYFIDIKVNSNLPSETEIEHLHKFDPSEVIVENFEKYTLSEDCCDCILITDDMYNIESINNNEIKINIDNTCSCDWFIIAGNQFPVNKNEEYYISFDMLSEKVIKRHMKFMFLDENKVIVGNEFLHDIEEEDKNKWHHYQQIIKIPENTSYIQFHIWSRGNKTENGFIRIKNLRLLNYEQMPLIDNVIIFESDNDSLKDFIKPITKNNKDITQKQNKIKYQRKNSMERNLSIETEKTKRLSIILSESFNTFWRLTNDAGSIKPKPVNGLLNSYTFYYDKSKSEMTLSIFIKTPYYIGIFLFVIGFIFYLFILIPNKLIGRLYKIFKRSYKRILFFIINKLVKMTRTKEEKS